MKSVKPSRFNFYPYIMGYIGSVYNRHEMTCTKFKSLKSIDPTVILDSKNKKLEKKLLIDSDFRDPIFPY